MSEDNNKYEYISARW